MGHDDNGSGMTELMKIYPASIGKRDVMLDMTDTQGKRTWVCMSLDMARALQTDLTKSLAGIEKRLAQGSEV